MNAPISIPEWPATPAEIPDAVGLTRLTDAYSGHVYEVLIGRSAPADLDAVFAHAVAALALLHTLMDRLQSARWATIRTALAADTTRAGEVAAACALDGTEVAAGLRSWAAGQVAAGLMAPPERGVVELLARAVRSER